MPPPVVAAPPSPSPPLPTLWPPPPLAAEVAVGSAVEAEPPQAARGVTSNRAHEKEIRIQPSRATVVPSRPFDHLPPRPLPARDDHRAAVHDRVTVASGRGAAGRQGVARQGGRAWRGRAWRGRHRSTFSQRHRVAVVAYDRRAAVTRSDGCRRRCTSLAQLTVSPRKSVAGLARPNTNGRGHRPRNSERLTPDNHWSFFSPTTLAKVAELVDALA